MHRNQDIPSRQNKQSKGQHQILRINQQNPTLILQKFTNHCATVIQSRFRSYIQQKRYKQFLPIYRRLKQVLYAGYMGWKTRKILKLSLIKNKINQIKQNKAKQNHMQIRIKKRDLSDEVVRLMKNGQWVYYFNKENKVPLGNSKNLRLGNNMQVQKLNLKSALKCIPKQSINKNSKKQNNQKSIQPKSNYQQQTIDQPQQNKKILKRAPKYQIPKKTYQQKSSQKNSNKKSVQKTNKLSIQITMQPELKQINNIICQTPSQNSINIKQFSFYSKQINKDSVKKMEKDRLEQSKLNQSQQSFRCINLGNTSVKKAGLQMTLSKRFNQQFSVKQNNIQPQDHLNNINSRVLHQFTKKKANPNIQSSKQTMYQSTQQKSNPKFYQNRSQTFNPNMNSVLKFKNDQFQKKKIQYLQKIKNFKKPVLK